MIDTDMTTTQKQAKHSRVVVNLI